MADRRFSVKSASKFRLLFDQLVNAACLAVEEASDGFLGIDAQNRQAKIQNRIFRDPAKTPAPVMLAIPAARTVPNI